MSDSSFSTNPIPPVQNDIIQSQKSQAAQSAQRISIIQEVSHEEFQEWADQFAVNTMAFARRAENLESKVRKKERSENVQKEETEDEGLRQIEEVSEIADQYEQKNPEVKAKALLTIRERITENDSVEDIIRKVTDAYPDPTLADEVLDFLIDTASTELAAKIKSAKENLNLRFEREIRAGRNILEMSRKFSQEGLGNPEGLRNMYRDITGNPKDSHTLFNELSTKFPYDKLKTVIAFMLHALGSDLKAKGPSIDRGELYRLLTETRTLQSILGVYRFFMLKMRSVGKSFAQHALVVNPKITFESLAKNFMKYLQDRYPASEKLFLLAREFGIGDELIAQEIIFTCMLEALRHVSPKLLRSQQHRQDVMTSYLEALDEIEEKLDDEEEEEENKRRKEKKNKDGESENNK